MIIGPVEMEETLEHVGRPNVLRAARDILAQHEVTDPPLNPGEESTGTVGRAMTPTAVVAGLRAGQQKEF